MFHSFSRRLTQQFHETPGESRTLTFEIGRAMPHVSSIQANPCAYGEESLHAMCLATEWPGANRAPLSGA